MPSLAPVMIVTIPGNCRGMASILTMETATPSTRGRWATVLVMGLVVAASSVVRRPAPVPVDPQVALGAWLFVDPRLSRDQDRSCATCHRPERGWADGLTRHQGLDGLPLPRNTPTVTNLDAVSSLFWDGRAATLEDQALGPIANPREMAMSMELLTGRLAAVPAYQAAFAKAFPGEPIGPATVAQALAAFERTLVARRSPMDRFLAGEVTALSRSARRGWDLFRAVRCTACHDGPDFTDGSFHAIGVASDDPGRSAVVPGASLRGAMRVPSLRNVALTAPYFHDGSQATLEDVVAFYDRGGDRPGDPLIRPLDLTARNRADLVEFLKSLTDPVRVRLPEPP